MSSAVQVTKLTPLKFEGVVYCQIAIQSKPPYVDLVPSISPKKYCQKFEMSSEGVG